MSKISCVICFERCVWCAGKCKCNMNKHQVTQTNEVITKLNLLWDKEKLIIVKTLWLKNMKADAIIQVIESWDYDLSKPEEIVKQEIVKKIMNWHCEYPAWSAREGKRVRCIHCQIPRFKWEGKLCVSLISK